MLGLHRLRATLKARVAGLGNRGDPAQWADRASAILEQVLVADDPRALNEAVNLLRRALAATPPESPDRATILSNLGAALYTRFDRVGELTDLEQAISLLQEAVAATPPNHPLYARHLSNLGAALQARFESVGELADLEQAISLLRQAVAATPPNHPTMPAVCRTSAARYKSGSSRAVS